MLKKSDYHLYMFIAILQILNYNSLTQGEENATSSSVITASSAITTQDGENTSLIQNINLTTPGTPLTPTTVIQNTQSLPVLPKSSTNNNSTVNVSEPTKSVSDNGDTTLAPEAKTENSTNTNVLSIFFVNDLQYDIFPVHSDNGSICVDNVTNCIGGVGRLRSYIKTKMKNNPNSLWLNAGNTLGGNWFKILKYKTALEAINYLDFTSMSVSPEVFQYGKEAGEEFLGKINSTIVSNVKTSHAVKSREYSVGMCNISVIGFMDNDTFGSGVVMENITEANLQELNKTYLNQNSSSHVITIALGSTTREKAKIIANTTKGIDIILYSGNCTPTEKEDNSTEYLCLDSVNKTDGNITHVYSLGMSHSDMAARFLVGELQITLDSNCNVQNITSSYKDYSDETDDTWISQLIEVAGLADLDKKLTENSKDLSGESDTCSHEECSLGDLIADSVVAALEHNIWGDEAARIAVIPAAIFQVNETVPKGDITATQLYNLVQHEAYLYTVPLTGRQLTEMFRISLNSKHHANLTEFLHVSNLLNVKYNKSGDNIFNIKSVSTVLNMSSTMKLEAVNVTDNETYYKTIVPYTLFQIDSYKKVLGTVNDSTFVYHNMTVIEAVIRVVNNTGYLPLPIVGNRQQKIEPVTIKPLPDCPSYTGTTILVTLVVTALLLGACYGLWWYMFKRRRERTSSTIAMMNLDYPTN